jgi:hypothetical protein
MIVSQGQNMPRGGYREGSGGKPKWIHGKTKTIRVPEALADRLLELARRMDEGYPVGDYTKAKYVDLSGVSVKNVRGKAAVFIEDLLKADFKVRPIKLVDMVRRQIDLDG